MATRTSANHTAWEAGNHIPARNVGGQVYVAMEGFTVPTGTDRMFMLLLPAHMAFVQFWATGANLNGVANWRAGWDKWQPFVDPPTGLARAQGWRTSEAGAIGTAFRSATVPGSNQYRDGLFTKRIWELEEGFGDEWGSYPSGGDKVIAYFDFTSVTTAAGGTFYAILYTQGD